MNYKFAEGFPQHLILHSSGIELSLMQAAGNPTTMNRSAHLHQDLLRIGASIRARLRKPSVSAPSRS